MRASGTLTSIGIASSRVEANGEAWEVPNERFLDGVVRDRTTGTGEAKARLIVVGGERPGPAAGDREPVQLGDAGLGVFEVAAPGPEPDRMTGGERCELAPHLGLERARLQQ